MSQSFRPADSELKPRARVQDVVVQELPDEVLVYDLSSHVAHCLNKVAAQVWGLCDGESTIRQIAEHVSLELGKPVDADLVWFALDELDRARLLTQPLSERIEEKKIARREIVRKLAYAAVAIPMVSSILAPQAASAQSPGCATTCRMNSETGSAAACGAACATMSGTCYSDGSCGTPSGTTTCQACAGNSWMVT